MATRRLLADVHPSPTLILGKEMTVLEAAELMTSARTNAGIVQDAKTGALVGILTDSDVSIKVIAGGRGLAATRVGDVMTPRPLCCRTDETATHALGVMASKRARHLPLLDAEGGVSGMLDITKVLYDAIAVLEDRKQKSQNRFWFQAGAPSLKIPSLADALRDRPPPATCAPGDALSAVFEGLTRTRRSVLVLGGSGELVGILSKSDVAKVALRVVRGGGGERAIGTLKAADAMTARPDHVSSEKTVLDALHRMHDGKHASLPVLDAATGAPLGVVDVLDLIDATDVHHGGSQDWLGELFQGGPRPRAASGGLAGDDDDVVTAPAALVGYVLARGRESVRVDASGSFEDLVAAAKQAFGFDGEANVTFEFSDAHSHLKVAGDSSLKAAHHMHDGDALPLAVVAAAPPATRGAVVPLLAAAALAAAAVVLAKRNGCRLQLRAATRACMIARGGSRLLGAATRLLASLPFDDGCGQWPVGVGKGALAPGFGGVHDAEAVAALLETRLDTTDRPYGYAERTTHALLVLLVSKRLVAVDQLRRAVEGLHPAHYASFSYYQKWAAAMAQLGLEAGLLNEREWADALAGAEARAAAPRFFVGDGVVVREDSLAERWRKPHHRVPGYALGARGVVVAVCGAFPDPEVLAFEGPGADAPARHLYRVRFSGLLDGRDTVDVEVYDHWLRPDAGAPTGGGHEQKGHAHGSRGDAEAAALDEEDDDGPGRRLMDALAAALVENGVVTRGELRDAVERIDALGVAAAGPRLVARAWVDDGFRRRLLEDATAAAAELGIAAANATAPTVLTALENTNDVHNLEAFDLAVPEATTVRVHDSTADLRYIVLPKRPEGTAGWAEADLAALVTRDAMIGVAAPRAPPG
ncbi:hypothetical protein SO694_00035164 [Aureococcus anophagefferens]|uniref:CBS domain-containing protein n=1 Tax=Aureococcus anophagefferens TaxID=44056 RepID=A0ABR1FKQ2_AURAN